MDARRGTLVIGVFAPAEPDALLSDVIQEGLQFHDDGADIIDLDTTPGGPFHDADDDTIALLVRGMAEVGTPVSVTTTSAHQAETAADHGARWIIDPSGATADPGMPGVAARTDTGWVIGPWSTRHDDWVDDPVDAYTAGLVRNVAALLDAGVRSDRIVLHACAGLSAFDEHAWLMLNHLDRLTALGYRVLVDARDGIAAAMSPEDSAERRDDAAVGLTVLAASFDAWGVRARNVGRVVSALQRILEPRPSA